MPNSSGNNQTITLIALLVIAWLLMNGPLLHLSGNDTLLWDRLPMQFVYLFGVWSVVLLLLKRILSRRSGKRRNG